MVWSALCVAVVFGAMGFCAPSRAVCLRTPSRAGLSQSGASRKSQAHRGFAMAAMPRAGQVGRRFLFPGICPEWIGLSGSPCVAFVWDGNWQGCAREGTTHVQASKPVCKFDVAVACKSAGHLGWLHARSRTAQSGSSELSQRFSRFACLVCLAWPIGHCAQELADVITRFTAENRRRTPRDCRSFDFGGLGLWRFAYHVTTSIDSNKSRKTSSIHHRHHHHHHDHHPEGVVYRSCCLNSSTFAVS